MTTLREAAQRALEALELYLDETNSNVQRKAITSLRNALAQEEQEPVDAEAALRCALAQRDWAFKQLQAQPNRRESQELTKEDIAQNLQSRHDAAKLLEERRQEVAQPRREWQGLSPEEINEIWCGAVMAQSTESPGLWVSGFARARAIEAKLKEKNHG